MLHIHNGDSSAGTAKSSGLAGEHLAWREALVCGPAPGGLTDDEFRKVRAEHLASAYYRSIEDCERGLRAQEQALARFSDHEEVVLWFDHDLFCQVQLIWLLNWFARQEIGKTKLSLISIGKFPRIDDFRGLGQLNPLQLASLLPQRHEVTARQLNLGRVAWEAYSAADPRGLPALLESDTTALPFLGSTLFKHLQRFPSARNGLGRVEDLGLELATSGHHEFFDLLAAFGKAEPVYGFGDAQFYLEMKALADALNPLIAIGGTSDTEGDTPIRSSFHVTETGRDVLNGAQDFVQINGIEKWLGGVHLSGNEAPWRWDESRKYLLYNKLL
jgi:hypothetical protein